MYLAAQPRIPQIDGMLRSGGGESGFARSRRGILQADGDSFRSNSSMNYGKHRHSALGEPQEYLMPVVTRGGGTAESKHDVSQHRVDQQSRLHQGDSLRTTTGAISIPPPRILLNQCKSRSSSVADLGYLSAQAKRSELAYLIVDLQNPTEQIFTGIFYSYIYSRSLPECFNIRKKKE